MIGKITAPRGERVEPLVYYLYGPGRSNEHTDPHIVVGWRHPAELEPPLRADGKRDFRRLTGLLKQPHAALGEYGYARPVWHCSLRAAPGDRMLSDEEWAAVAHDVMDRTGLARSGEEAGGKLAADLTWPKLTQRWHPARQSLDIGLTAAERAAVWDDAAQAAADATARMRALMGTSPAAAADAAWAASGTLHVAAAMLGSRPLREAADAYDRAAPEPFGRIPAPTPAGNQLRRAARLMSLFAHLSGDRTLTPAILITRLAALAEAVAELRQAQQRAAQAAAARTAAGCLHAACPAPPARPVPPPRARTAVGLAAASFPGPPVPPRSSPGTWGQHGADQTAHPPRRPPQPRPRGPAR